MDFHITRIRECLDHHHRTLKLTFSKYTTEYSMLSKCTFGNSIMRNMKFESRFCFSLIISISRNVSRSSQSTLGICPLRCFLLNCKPIKISVISIEFIAMNKEIYYTIKFRMNFLKQVDEG